MACAALTCAPRCGAHWLATLDEWIETKVVRKLKKAETLGGVMPSPFMLGGRLARRVALVRRLILVGGACEPP